MSTLRPAANVEARVEWLARDTDLYWVTRVLVTQRQAILDRWLDAAASQPFHEGRRERAVADDIPRLLDALIEFLVEHSPRTVDAGPPLEHEKIRAAAQGHARARVNQQLQPAHIVVEFRLLRQEISRALRAGLPDEAPPDDIVGAALLINDALDGAITLGLEAIVQRIEDARDQLIATIMHDLRTPITAIKGFAQLMLRRPRFDPTAPENILTAANRLQRMTDDLLEMSQLESGQLELTPATVDLVAVARTAIDELRPLATTHRLTLEAPDESIVGMWDQSRLQQVFQNLLTNAMKYSPDGTEVTVRLSVTDSHAQVSIEDEGVGIPAEALPYIFDRFYRVREHRSGADGLGLGLFITRSLIEAHGGSIWAENRASGRRGCVFTFRLPRIVASGEASP